jgi:hypothetical protein
MESRLKEVELTVLMDDYISADSLISQLIADMTRAKVRGHLKLTPIDLINFLLVVTHVLYKC